MGLISKPHQPLAPVASYLGSFSVAVRKLRMVMQFQGLENPIQISLHHSHRLSGFVPEGMSVKPAKGRSLHLCPYVGSPTALGKYMGLFVRGQSHRSPSEGGPDKQRRRGS